VKLELRDEGNEKPAIPWKNDGFVYLFSRKYGEKESGSI
jgi:hypothetical protein